MFKNVKDVLMILLGNFILAFASTLFIIPYNIMSGTTAGVAVVLQPYLGVSELVIVDVMTIGLFLLGWAFLGHAFAARTFICSASFPIFMEICSRILPQIQVDTLLAAIFGGLLAGVGIGIAMRHGASTGGMDIPPLILNKLTGIKLSSLVLCTDLSMAALGLIAYDAQMVLIGMIAAFACSVGIEKILTFGGASRKSVQVISDHYEEINRMINQHFERGTTLYDVTGGYSGKPRRMVMCVVSAQQYAPLIEMINQIDPQAFVVTTDVTDVHGEGFTYRYKG